MQPKGTEHEMNSFFALLRRRWLLVLTIAALLGTLAFLFAQSRPATFQSNAQILLEMSRPRGLDATANIEDRNVANEVAILNGLGLSQELSADLGRGANVNSRAQEEQDVIDLSTSESSAQEAQEAVATHLENYLEDRRTDYVEAAERARARLAEINEEIELSTGNQLALQSLAQQLVTVETQLRTLEGATESAGVKIISAATLPRGKEQLSSLEIGFATFIAGLALGVGLAGLVDHLDTRLRRKDDLYDITGADLVVGVPGASLSDPLAVLNDGQGATADAYRSLASGLVANGVGRDVTALHVGAVDSAEAGSVAAANVATALSLAGYEVALAGMDPWDRQLSGALGLERRMGLADVASGSTSVAKAATSIDGAPSLAVIPAGESSEPPGELVLTPAWTDAVERVKAAATITVLDGGIIAGRPATAAVAGDATLLVTTTNTKSESVAQAMLDLRAVDARVLACINEGRASNRNGWGDSDAEISGSSEKLALDEGGDADEAGDESK